MMAHALKLTRLHAACEKNDDNEMMTMGTLMTMMIMTIMMMTIMMMMMADVT
jgi:hypothetical protein